MSLSRRKIASADSIAVCQRRGSSHRVKLPRDISGKEAVRALKRLGFEFVDQRGSHIRLAKASIRITVPNHDAILPKTLQSVLKQAQVSLEEFIDAL